MINMLQWEEEQDAFFSQYDRFDGFDRGDLDVARAELAAHRKFMETFVGPLPRAEVYDDIPF